MPSVRENITCQPAVGECESYPHLSVEVRALLQASQDHTAALSNSATAGKSAGKPVRCYTFTRRFREAHDLEQAMDTAVATS